MSLLAQFEIAKELMSRSSPGVRRVASILNFIAEHPGQAFTLTDLVRALKLSRATCHALLTGLVEVGYLYRASDKNYVLGPALVQIGRVAAEHASPLEIARPEMRALADEFETICSAFFLDKDDVVVRERAASVAHLGFSVPLGARLRLRAPFSAIFYAWSPDEAEAWLDSATPPPTPEHRETMAKAMAFARDHGFMLYLTNPAVPDGAAPEDVFNSANEFPVLAATELDLEQDYPVTSLSAPVFDRPGHVAFVLGLSGVRRTIKGETIKYMGRRLREACDRVTAFSGIPTNS